MVEIVHVKCTIVFAHRQRIIFILSMSNWFEFSNIIFFHFAFAKHKYFADDRNTSPRTNLMRQKPFNLLNLNILFLIDLAERSMLDIRKCFGYSKFLRIIWRKKLQKGNTNVNLNVVMPNGQCSACLGSVKFPIKNCVSKCSLSIIP